MATASFRKPPVVMAQSKIFGLPVRGMFGRGIYSPKVIVLHALRVTLESFDSQVLHSKNVKRTLAQPRHPSLHYAIGYDGEIHQYILDTEIAWGLWDYEQWNYPETYPFDDSFVWHNTYPNVSPDYYSLHIGAMSGMLGLQANPPRTFIPMSEASVLAHARLIAWLCHLYEIECNNENVVMHHMIDLQFVGDCIGDANYPYVEILALANEIIDAGGWTDAVLDPEPTIAETTGPFTVALSRVSSDAYIIS